MALIAFAVVNRAPVAVDLWPLGIVVDIPLFVLLFGALLLGVLWGGLAAWGNAGKVRRANRQNARDVQSLRAETHRQKDRIATLEADLKARDAAPALSNSPALPSPTDQV